MTNKEAKDIALSLCVALNVILNPDSLAEDAANVSISAIRDVIVENPKVKEWVELFFRSDTEADDFNEQWDREIALIKFIKD